jgi:hypothetical protein
MRRATAINPDHLFLGTQTGNMADKGSEDGP